MVGGCFWCGEVGIHTLGGASFLLVQMIASTHVTLMCYNHWNDTSFDDLLIDSNG